MATCSLVLVLVLELCAGTGKLDDGYNDGSDHGITVASHVLFVDSMTHQ